MPPPSSHATACSNNATKVHTLHKGSAWQACPTTKPTPSTIPPGPSQPYGAEQKTLLQPLHAQAQTASNWFSQPSGSAARQPQEKWAAPMDLRHSDDRRSESQSKHAVSAQHYENISDSPFVQIGSPNQNASYFAPSGCHSKISRSVYDSFTYTMYTTPREIFNDVLQAGSAFPLRMKYQPMQQYPQQPGTLHSANFVHAPALKPVKNTPIHPLLLSVKPAQDNQPVNPATPATPATGAHQTSSAAQNYDIDLPLPKEVSYHDAKQHFIRLKKYMDIFYQQVSKTKNYEAKNATDEGHFLHKGTDYLHYLFLDTYLTLVGHEEYFNPNEAKMQSDQDQEGKMPKLSADEREIFKSYPPLDAIEIICRLGHVDTKNYALMVARVLEEEHVPENNKTNSTKMDFLPRIDIENIHGLTKHQFKILKKSNSLEKSLIIYLKQRFLPKFKMNSEIEEEEKEKLTADIEKYILEEHYNDSHEKEIIFARISKLEIVYKIVEKNEYIKDIKSAYDSIKEYPHSQITADFSIADQDLEEEVRAIDPSFEDHSIFEADSVEAEIIAPNSSDFFGQL